jgi:hypothetical protein
MDEPTVFADTAPCGGIRITQTAHKLIYVVHYNTFASIAFNLIYHCVFFCRASFSYLPINSYASLSTVFSSPASVSQANIASLARTDPIVGMLFKKSLLIDFRFEDAEVFL